MPNGNEVTKGGLQDCIDEATQILEAAYVPDADRETLATTIGDALAGLGGDTTMTRTTRTTRT